MAYIKVIEYNEAEGALRDIYDDLIYRRGQLAEVHKIQSLNPDTILKHMELYLSIMFSKSPLTRAQREMLAVVVSVANKCVYCQTHHSAALNNYWKDDKKIANMVKDYTAAGLSASDTNLCALAWQLTKTPNATTEPIIFHLKEMGLDDRSVLDATLVIAYFNFVNRIVLGLGVEIEQGNGTGYKY